MPIKYLLHIRTASLKRVFLLICIDLLHRGMSTLKALLVIDIIGISKTLLVNIYYVLAPSI